MAKKKNKPSLLWIIIMFVDMAVIFTAQLIYPDSLVLGNANLSPFASLLVVSFFLTLLISLIPPLIRSLKIKIEDDLSLAIFYALVNISGLWLIARGAHYTGFGISSFFVAVVLGVVLNIVQYGAWKFSIGKKDK